MRSLVISKFVDALAGVIVLLLMIILVFMILTILTMTNDVFLWETNFPVGQDKRLDIYIYTHFL